MCLPWNVTAITLYTFFVPASPVLPQQCVVLVQVKVYGKSTKATGKRQREGGGTEVAWVTIPTFSKVKVLVFNIQALCYESLPQFDKCTWRNSSFQELFFEIKPVELHKHVHTYITHMYECLRRYTHTHTHTHNTHTHTHTHTWIFSTHFNKRLQYKISCKSVQ